MFRSVGPTSYHFGSVFLIRSRFIIFFYFNCYDFDDVILRISVENEIRVFAYCESTSYRYGLHTLRVSLNIYILVGPNTSFAIFIY